MSTTRSGLPSVQSSVKFGAGGRSRGSPSGAPASGPGDDRGDVLLGEGPIVLELEPEVRRGLPRGHAAILDDRGDVRRALPDLLVGLECERSDLPLAVAFLAVLLHDRRDVPGVGRVRDHGGSLGDRAADGGDVRHGYRLAGEHGSDRVFQLAAPRAWRSAPDGRRTGRRSARGSGPYPGNRGRTPRGSWSHRSSSQRRRADRARSSTST